ncbi:MAG: GAF domain-containing protein [Chloroflexota bacterium]
MLKRFRRLVAPPVFDGDEAKTHTARVLSLIVWCSSPVFVLLSIAVLLSRWPVIASSLVTAMVLATVAALVALRAGYVRWTSYAFMFFLWLVCVVLVCLTGGIFNPQTLGFLVLILAVGLLLGMQAAWTFFGFSVVAVVAIALLDTQGMLPAPFLSPAWALSMVILNMALGSGLLWLVLSNLNQALRRSREYAQALEAERATLEQRVEERTHLVNAAREEAETARLALEAQVWQATGLVQLNEVLHGEQSLSRLANRAVQAICRHIGSPVGALYLLEKDTLFLCGGYAADAPENPPSFRLGEGLVGQAALDKEPIHLTDVPVEYLTIRSGLGNTTPREVAVWPLTYNQSVIGVVEVGLLSALTDAQRYFFEQASRAMIAALQTVQARQRVDELLAETQAQSEELQSREEELRAINERLLAQAKRSEAHA